MAGLATTDDLAAYLGEPPANPAQASFALDAASELVRTYCGWSITREPDAAWTLDAIGGRLLALPTLHLIAVASVLVDGKPVDDAESSSAGLLYRHAGWPNGYGSVEVHADHGHDTTPRHIVAVVCSLASRLLATAGQGPVTGYRVGGVQITYGRDGGESIGVTLAERLVLDRHRVWGSM